MKSRLLSVLFILMVIIVSVPVVFAGKAPQKPNSKQKALCYKKWKHNQFKCHFAYQQGLKKIRKHFHACSQKQNRTNGPGSLKKRERFCQDRYRSTYYRAYREACHKFKKQSKVKVGCISLRASGYHAVIKAIWRGGSKTWTAPAITVSTFVKCLDLRLQQFCPSQKWKNDARRHYNHCKQRAQSKYKACLSSARR